MEVKGVPDTSPFELDRKQMYYYFSDPQLFASHFRHCYRTARDVQADPKKLDCERLTSMKLMTNNVRALVLLCALSAAVPAFAKRGQKNVSNLSVL